MEGSCGQLKLLDLYCCAGGAGVGYAWAGFDVTGVDIKAQPHYPYELLVADALQLLAERQTWIRGNFAAVHASPPCQAHSALSKGNRLRFGHRYKDYVAATRYHLDGLGLPYVIENVAGAPIRHDVWLCGEMFGLGVVRHRFFELGNWSMDQPAHVPHRGRVRGWRHGQWHDGPYVQVYGKGGDKGSVAEWQAAMGIDWTAVPKELTEAIPPAYTHHIGRALQAWLVAGPGQHEAPGG